MPDVELAAVAVVVVVELVVLAVDAVVVGHVMEACATDLVPAIQLPRPPERLDMFSPELV